MKRYQLNPIKRRIIRQIRNSEGAFFGDIVRQTKYSSQTVLKHLMDLKVKGYVYKDDDGGRFKMTKG